MPRGVRSNLEIVVYGLGKLGGALRKVPTEDIAHEAFQLAPDRFSWVLERYGRFPDKLVTKTALEDAAKAKYGALVRGSYARETAKDGWFLTPEGTRWLSQNEERGYVPQKLYQ